MSTMSSNLAIDVHGLGKRYRVSSKGPRTHLGGSGESSGPNRSRDFWALRNITFDVHPGETLGVMGPNGAGKSTLLKILAEVSDPSEGYASVRGRVGSLLEVGAGFHQDLTGRDNIMLVGTILGMRRRETLAAFNDIVEFSGIEPFIDTPVKRYSSGMYLRLAFSVAAHLDAEILLIDEALAVGDQAFREKCITKLRDLATTGRTVLFVSHDPGSVARLCNRAIVIDQGRLVNVGSAEDALRIYSGIHANPTDAYQADGVSVERTQIVSVRRECGPHELRSLIVRPTVPIGEPITLQIDVNVPVGTDRSQLNVLVEVKGGDLWSTTGAMFKLQDEGPGHHRLHCHFPALRVAPGRFTFSVTLRNDDRTIEAITQLCPFEVDGIGRSEPTWTWRYVEDAQWHHEVVENTIGG